MVKEADLTFAEQVARMREVLRPQGSLPLVGLRLASASYVSDEFIKEVIDEVEKLPWLVELGNEITPLQRLGLMVLKDSSWIE